MALALLALGPWQALAGPAHVPPDLDCSKGFDALRNWASWLPGAAQNAGNPNVITVSEPNAWRVEIAFTEPGQPAHPAVTLRKFLKQVTGVWTAQSKGCSYGNQAQFVALMTEMKAADKTLTDASRVEVERKRKELSPLGSVP
jgi:hypothetical protein